MYASWPHRLQRILDTQSCVMVTVISVIGSAPRALGSRMIVTTQGLEGSVGGGNLEYEATATARDMLRENTAAQQKITYGLGPALNQCCGGGVSLLFELFPRKASAGLEFLSATQPATPRLLATAVDREQVSKYLLRPDHHQGDKLPRDLHAQALGHLASGGMLPVLMDGVDEQFFIEQLEQRSLPLLLFGAGHVAKALVEALRHLPFTITWIDSRAEQFPAGIPDNTNVRISQDLPAQVRDAPAGSLFLVMTHSHQLDEDICFEVLSGNDGAWLGLIGSETKYKRFVHRLAKRGIDENALQRLVCPVGHSGITGKRPATIAVSIAAQLLAEQVPANWR